jgi:hypothetical protein
MGIATDMRFAFARSPCPLTGVNERQRWLGRMEPVESFGGQHHNDGFNIDLGLETIIPDLDYHCAEPLNAAQKPRSTELT